MSKKHILGIVGGMGSQASIWLMNRIIALSNVDKDQDYLEIVLHNNSNIPDRTEAILCGGKCPLTQLKRSFELFNDYGVNVAVMACMTAYYYYDKLINSFSGELIHPLDFVIDELAKNPSFTNKSRIGLIGSSGMIYSGVFHKKLNPLDYKVICLDVEDQEKHFMQPIYKKNGFKAGNFSTENVNQFRQQADILKNKGAEIIVGACSEIPLILNQDNVDLPFIDSFDLLAHKLVDHCYHKKLTDVLQA